MSYEEKLEKLRGKIERALDRAGITDPEKRAKQANKLLSEFKSKEYKQREAEEDRKRFKEELAVYYVTHEERLKAAEKRFREAELQAEQDKLRRKFGIPVGAAKAISEKVENAVRKVESEALRERAAMPTEKFNFQTTKELSDFTKKTYGSKLNKLAAAGFKTKEDLKAHPVDVIKTISTLLEGVKADKQQQEARIFYSAIFAALHNDEFLQDPKNPYRRAFHTYRPAPPKDSEAGKEWKGFDEFVDGSK